MVYRLEANEKVSDGIRRVILECTDRAIGDLSNPDIEANEAIHNTRKLCKRIRAALRLVRAEIGERYFKQYDISIRDAARLLSAARDSWVMVETFDKLIADTENRALNFRFSGLRHLMFERYLVIKSSKFDEDESIRQVIEMFRYARTQIENLVIQQDGISAFGSGLRRVYARGRKAMILAYQQPTPEHFHEWRKRVKYFWHQIELLVNLWPNTLYFLAEEVHTLSEYLGDDHDLAVLKEVVRDEMDSIKWTDDVPVLSQLIDQQRDKLQASAQPLGNRIYAETPKAFTRRIGSYWDARCLAADLGIIEDEVNGYFEQDVDIDTYKSA